LGQRLQGRAIEANVNSAGLLRGGFPMWPMPFAVLASCDLDASAHESWQVTTEILRNADLVIGMTRRHVIEAVVTAREIWPRAFTLKELVRRGGEVGPRTKGQPLEEWLRKAAADRTHNDLLGDSPLDDIADPVSEPDATTFNQAADEIERHIDRLDWLVWGSA